NRGVGHTFTGLPSGIVRAQLQIRMKAHSDIPSNDSLNLGLTCACGSPRFSWGSLIRNLPGTGGHWNNGDPAVTFLLELGNLPPSNANGACAICQNILGVLASGALDVYVQDDT